VGLTFAGPAALGSARHVLAVVGASYLLLWGVVFLLSRASPIETWRRFGLMSASVTLMIALLEIPALAGLVDYRGVLGTSLGVPWQHPDNRLDPVLLHIHEPHLRLRWKGVDYAYDAHGLRNVSDLAQADVLVIGDSFIEGVRVAAERLTGTFRLRSGEAVRMRFWPGPEGDLTAEAR
jgi:hypothetical protein